MHRERRQLFSTFTAASFPEISNAILPVFVFRETTFLLEMVNRVHVNWT